MQDRGGHEKLHPDLIPWTEATVAELFNRSRDTDLGPNKVMQFHKTLVKLGSILGMKEDFKSDYLRSKRDKVRQCLSKELVAPDRRAVCPTRELVKALEQATVLAEATSTAVVRARLPGLPSRHCSSTCNPCGVTAAD